MLPEVQNYQARENLLAPTSTTHLRQVALTVVYGAHAEKLDRTFTSFSRNPFLALHAFILGNCLPEKRCSEIT